MSIHPIVRYRQLRLSILGVNRFCELPEVSHDVKHGLFVEFIMSCIHYHWAVHKVLHPVRTPFHIQSNVPVCPATYPMIQNLQHNREMAEFNNEHHSYNTAFTEYFCAVQYLYYCFITTSQYYVATDVQNCHLVMVSCQTALLLFCYFLTCLFLKGHGLIS